MKMYLLVMNFDCTYDSGRRYVNKKSYAVYRSEERAKYVAEQLRDKTETVLINGKPYDLPYEITIVRIPYFSGKAFK